eukprot:Plantae.Rhodophyta-Hildenbrandia_rubra.ctg32237.p1 GENE.Plantae.Rhodophyta-Hildenbrandia_rubra.ctg32237~~Plantae.Rhodophyta-Hildenbrandia_rubra.ctg32237.p1  ORF type:complete len:556 (-),score=96.44 Plantae.Rhodophyta-Hildenbrandia_rubra.ctg32237:1176-2843(-)
MCGIFAVIGSKLSKEELERLVKSCTSKLTHRGPDDSGFFVSDDGWCALGFARLSIVDPEHGAQPMFNDARTAWSITNGEIYNHEKLHEDHLQGRKLHSHSDCEVILPLYEKFAKSLDDVACTKLYNSLKGVFASVVVDLDKKQFVAARDPIGIRAMFKGTSKDGAVWFASEAKALMDHCDHITAFLPGHYYTSVKGQETKSDFASYFEPVYYNPKYIAAEKADLRQIHDSFVLSCKRRLMSDAPVGVFISGGLDSSLVASIAKKHLPPSYPFHSFSCGLKGSPDVAAAQKVADYLGTKHHVLTFTVEDGVKALTDVIYHLETYDITTIRASTPMYLLSKLCKEHVKVVLSGEGADEILGGYLYFHNAPNADEFHKETVRRLKLLYTSDVLRGDRSTAAQSLELRVPFLDRDFLDVICQTSPEDKMMKEGRIEKWIMRQAFAKDFCGTEYLPDEILWRQKEQFSDGVGYSWIDGLKEHCSKSVSDSDMASAAQTFPHDPPTTKEAYFYRKIFEKLYGDHKGVEGLRQSIFKWIPKWSDSTDPSGRAQKVHVSAYKN